METDFWLTRWANEQIAFHQPDGHPLLADYWPALGLAEDARVFVPLCGKSRDMVWLAAQGHRVIGAELSARAARDFFAEQRCTPTITTTDGCEHYAAGRIEIWVGDFFALSAQTRAGFDAFYDRAALIALPQSMRGRYVEHLLALMPAGTTGLLITLDYPPEQMDGPPFAVTDSEVRERFGVHGCGIEHLTSRDPLAEGDPLSARGLRDACENVYLIRR